MKTFIKNLFMMLALLAGINQAAAQGTTAFTYQGQLRDGGTNANGTYTMTFKLYDAVSGGIQIGGDVTTSPTLANGLFSVDLDFGTGAFSGTSRWLDIIVAGDTLTPRVQVLPAPYAQFAAVAATVKNGAIMNAHLAGNAVNTTNIQNGAITTTQIANGAVTEAKIVSVNGAKVSGAVASATFAASAASLVGGTWNVSVGNYQTDSNVLNFNVNNAFVVGMFLDGLLVNGGIEANDVLIHGNLEVDGNLTVGGNPISPIPQMRVFFTNGAFIVPTNVTKVMVELWGGGGGGGMGTNGYDNQGRLLSGGGGGGGEYVKGTIGVTPGTSYSVTVGQGGQGGVGVSANGTSGQASSVDGFVTAYGGGSGSGAPNFNGGFGGSNGNRDPQTHRVSGSSGETYYDGKSGGSAASGGFATGGNSGGTPGAEPGGGGNGDGGRGANGRVIVYY